jgi:phage baseplate assembly protein W
MAIEVRINPIDFEPNTAIGIDLPMNASSGTSFRLNYLSIDQAVANAKNLLLTNRGERIMQPEFGCDLRKSLFQNITEELTLDIENRIRTSFEYWLPYIFINKLTVNDDIDANRVNVTLSISLVGNEVDTRSIQLEIINTQQNG